jgi:hypothetical protein
VDADSQTSGRKEAEVARQEECLREEVAKLQVCYA